MSHQESSTCDQDDEYEHCPNCERKFFPGRLALHLCGCTPEKPMKRRNKFGNSPRDVKSPTQKLKNFFGNLNLTNNKGDTQEDCMDSDLQSSLTLSNKLKSKVHIYIGL